MENPIAAPIQGEFSQVEGNLKITHDIDVHMKGELKPTGEDGREEAEKVEEGKLEDKLATGTGEVLPEGDVKEVKYAKRKAKQEAREVGNAKAKAKAKAKELLSKSAVLEDNGGGEDWLPEGWIIETRIRKGGDSKGTTDKYYRHPVLGHRFRSKCELMFFLANGMPRKRKSRARGPYGDVSSEDKGKYDLRRKKSTGESFNEGYTEHPQPLALSSPATTVERLGPSANLVDITQTDVNSRPLDLPIEIPSATSNVTRTPLPAVSRLEGQGLPPSYYTSSPLSLPSELTKIPSTFGSVLSLPNELTEIASTFRSVSQNPLVPVASRMEGQDLPPRPKIPVISQKPTKSIEIDEFLSFSSLNQWHGSSDLAIKEDGVGILTGKDMQSPCGQELQALSHSPIMFAPDEGQETRPKKLEFSDVQYEANHQ